MDTVFVQYNEADERVSQTGLPMPMQNIDGILLGGKFPILTKAPTAKQRSTLWPESARRIYQIEKFIDWDKAERDKELAKLQIEAEARTNLYRALTDPTISDFQAHRQTVLNKMQEDIGKL